MSSLRGAALGVALATTGFALAGCGGSNSSSVASLPLTTGTTSTSQGGAVSAGASRAALVTCLKSHGLQAVLGSAGTASGSTISVFGVLVSGTDPASPQFRSAMQACRKFLPGGGPPTLTPAQQAERAKAMARFAACMRTHGLPSFPDPNGQGFFPPGSIQKIDPGSPLVAGAFKACQSLQAKVGPRIALP